MRAPSSSWLQAGLLLGLAGLCALIANATAGPARRLAWLGRPQVEAAPAPAATPDPSQPVREVSSGEAWDLYQAKAPFLDARRRDAYLAGHVAGAWNACVWESDLDARLTEFEARANPRSTDPLVLYCSGGDCEDSRLLADKLVAMGYRDLRLYRDGFPDWTRLGRPVGKGEQP